ncbi:hypothetical protein O1611_g572 [Lasiodiplodia mahajangana]|uniref:Uncharacterized protein n=1 Tax=Lasiodiplodia mahajangana TaxID=1108764 RepID=A0ACC2K0R8_9PEZI|nr:hypothetical protein O1611_g572 [Lasiodiplodia mahajangana]
MSTNYITERPAGKEHIPLYTKGFVAVRIIQLVLGIICLGLTAYTVAVLPITGAALMLFTAIVTLITSIYILVAHFGPPQGVQLLGDPWLGYLPRANSVIFWLISFALLASQAAILFAYSDYYYGYYSGFTILGSITAAAAGLGAVNWVVYVVALILHSIALHRHRKAGLHAMPGVAPSAPTAGTPAGVPEGEKIAMEPQPPQTYYPPQQVYEAAYQQPQQYEQQPQQHQQQPQQPQQQQQQPTY